jgi:phospholipase/carboxylesterase
MSITDSNFVHVYRPGDDAALPTLLLLHGTGGDEHDLLALAPLLLPHAGILSPRGKVLERGMPRFFRRFAPGVFDLDDLTVRTEELATFVAASTDRYALDPGNVIAVGFSNGASIAANLLLSKPAVLRAAVLLRAMAPMEPSDLPDLAATHVYIGGGKHDEMIEPAKTEQLAALLRQAGANVTLRWDEGGHRLTRQTVHDAGAWLARTARPAS